MYTAKEVRDQRISFKPMSREQFDKLKAHFEKLYPGDYSKITFDTGRYFRFYQELGYPKGEQANDMSYSYTEATKSLRSSKEISFEEFDFQERKLLGYKCPMDLFGGHVKAGELYKLTPDETEYYPSNFTYSCKLPIELVETWEPVYEEEFIVGDWVVVLSSDEGYKNGLVINKAVQLTGINRDKYLPYVIQYESGRVISHNKIRKATQEEITAAQVKTVRMGGENGFDLTVTGKKVFHKSEDITLYVHDIQETFGELLQLKVSSKGVAYDFQPKDLIISKTGCENKETKLTEWLALYELIKP